MAIKKIRTSIEKEHEVVQKNMHFGYVLQNSEKRGNSVYLTFDRDPGENGQFLAALESEYKQISKPFPTGGFIWAILSAGMFAAYFVLKNTFLYSIIFLILGIVFAGIAVFLLILFISLVPFKRRLINELYLRGDRFQGIVKEYPVARNIEPATSETGIIRKSIPDILKSNHK